MRAWLRRNRWGLVGLPVAAALLVAGNGQRVKGWWWQADLRYAAATADQGEWLTYAEDFEDAVGPATHRITFRITGLERIDSYTDQWGTTTTVSNPAYDAWRVHLDGKADPDTVLVGCSMALTEADGTRYEWADNTDNIQQDQLYPCLPADAYGPSTSISRGADERDLGGPELDPSARAPQWSVEPVFFVPKGTEITGVMLWWQPPSYAKVSVRPD
ncbi:hypothetical protein [Nocardioides sp.]|uniref:hypothetical protein n=1 Tax=Nocardioides sp. TaxID=35761 RepID=UPI0039E5D251